MDERETKEPRGMALWRKNLGGKYGQAGIDPADDDALAEQSMKDYDEQHDALKRYKDRDAKMDELFARQPQSAAMLMAMAADGDKDTPASRLRNFFGDEICEMLLDKDVDDAALDKAFAERRENLKRIEEEDKKDKAAWKATLERWQKSHQELGLSVDETNAALGRMEDFVERFISRTCAAWSAGFQPATPRTCAAIVRRRAGRIGLL